MANRREFLVQATRAAGAVSLLQPLQVFAGIGVASPSASAAGTITIVHAANSEGQWHARQNNTEAFIGGLQMVGKTIKAVKSEMPFVVAIDAGNMICNRSFAEQDCRYFYKAIQTAGFDAVAPGSIDLSKGLNYFSRLANETALPLVQNNQQGRTNLPYSIIKKGSIKTGIINAGANALKMVRKTPVLQAAEAITQTADHLRTTHNCDLIVCVVQSAENKSTKLAAFSSGIDVMLSSIAVNHLHSTHVLRNKVNEEVILSYAGRRGSMINRIDFHFNDKGVKQGFEAKAILPGADATTITAMLRRNNIYDV